MRCVTISVTSDGVIDFVAEQLEAHDYVSNPAVYDTDEEYATFEDAARALGTLIGVYVEGYLTNGKETQK